MCWGKVSFALGLIGFFLFGCMLAGFFHKKHFFVLYVIFSLINASVGLVLWIIAVKRKAPSSFFPIVGIVFNSVPFLFALIVMGIFIALWRTGGGLG